MYLKEYSPDKVNITLAGILNVKGVAEGTFLEMSRNTPRTNVSVGGYGDAAITKTPDRTGTVTITLLQNSETNEYLSHLVNAEDLTGELNRFDIVVEEPSGGVLAIAKRCHVQEPAPITLGDGQNAKVWTFFTEDLFYLDVPEGKTSGLADAANIVSGFEAVSSSLSKVIN